MSATTQPTATPRPSRSRTKLVLLALTATTLLAALALALLGPRAADAADRHRDRNRDHQRCAPVARDLARTEQALADLVAAGTLDQTEANAVAAALLDAAPDRAQRCADRVAQRAETIQAVSDLLTLAPEEIRERRRAGESLAEIAETEGVTRADLVAALRDIASSRLEEAVADDRITATIRAELEKRAFAAIDRLVDHHRGDRLRPGVTDLTSPAIDLTPAASASEIDGPVA